MGACSGLMAPTAAPAPYAGVCQYNKCAMVESTETNYTPGSTGCSCRANQTAGVGCTKKVETKVCTDTDVDPWSNSVDYVTDDVVRVGTQKFKCREWPNFFWCRMAAYKPDLEPNGVWNEAWTKLDMCESSKPCDVSGPDLGTAAQCYLEINPALTPEICGPLLTPDFLEYLAPAADCLVAAGGGLPHLLFICLLCTQTIGNCNVEEKICDPERSIIRNLCVDECYSPAQQECESVIQTGLLCVTSSPPAVDDAGIIYGGMNFGPDYECSAL